MQAFRPGDSFGDYTAIRKLGNGGMGEVWLLRSVSGTEVAAKILDPAQANSRETRRRFLREARLALGVKHPNLVETYDIGEDPDSGLCYILMEYVPGGTLADLLKTRGALTIADAVSIVRSMAGVLELARKRGIVHRDIKPANIMFAADGTPKLADLGIARDGSSEVETTVTQASVIMGTPAYMAPEQMLNAHNVDTRADIYSLGVVFFEMLTGERPNKNDTVVQLMAKAVKGEPLPDVRTLRPEVSASLAQLLNMMVVPDKDGRISTPGQITNALAIIDRGGRLERIPVAAKPVPRIGPKVNGNLPWYLLIAAGVLVGLVAIFGRGLYKGTGPAKVPAKVVLPATPPVRPLVPSPVLPPVSPSPVLPPGTTTVIRTVIRTNVVERTVERNVVVTNVVSVASMRPGEAVSEPRLEKAGTEAKSAEVPGDHIESAEKAEGRSETVKLEEANESQAEVPPETVDETGEWKSPIMLSDAEIVSLRKLKGSSAVQKIFDRIFPGWRVSSCAEVTGNGKNPTGFISDFYGRHNICCTLPRNSREPVRISRTLTIPEKGAQLRYSVLKATYANAGFKVEVTVDGKVINERRVTGYEWVDNTVDLSAWRGKKIRLEIRQAQIPKFHNARASWARLEVR